MNELMQNKGEAVRLLVCKRQSTLNANSFEIIWRAVVGLGLSVLVIAALTINAHAQQTVFNVPTTDVLDKGKARNQMTPPRSITFRLL
jgi:hypothetical protein